MRTIVDGFREMVHLIGDTFRLWWRNLLPLATWFLAGYHRASRRAPRVRSGCPSTPTAASASGCSRAGVLMQIAAYVGMIRTCATSLYRWRDAAGSQAEETSDPTQRGLLELLAVTLLPLVAVWSAWGFLEIRFPSSTSATWSSADCSPGSEFFQLVRRPVAQVPAGDRDPARAAPGVRSGRRPLAEPAGEVRPGLGGVVLPADHRRRDAVRDRRRARSGSRSAASGTGRWAGGTD